MPASSTPAELAAKIDAQDAEIGLLREEIRALRAELAIYNRALTAACRAAGLEYGDGTDGSRTAWELRLVSARPESLPSV